MMEVKEIMRHIDHTLLKPVSTWEGIQALCEEAIEFGAASVCVPPCYIRRIHDTYGNRLKICTVVGFPLGYSTTEAKLAETRQALADGVDEVDMVINIAEVKNGHFAFVTDEIRALRQAVGSKVLKVIIETCLLTDEEKTKACELSEEAGAAFVKTSTGFSTGGATLDDIRLMKKTVGDRMQVKASGGIRTPEFTRELLEAGADRIGAGNGLALI